VSEPEATRDQRSVAGRAVPTPVQPAEGFGALVRAYRRRWGLTQAQVAAQCGLSRQFVSDVERGRVPDVASWQERTLPLVGLLGIPPEELTGLGVLTKPEARLLRLAGQAGTVTRSQATGQVRLALSVAELGELAAAAAELAGQAQAEAGDPHAAVLHARTHVRWLLGLVGCWDYRLTPITPPAAGTAMVVQPAGAGDR
jgi:transcriptional regulator with XRE-family HTH domain